MQDVIGKLGIKTISPYGTGGPRQQPGSFDVRIDRAKYHRSTNPQKPDEAIIIEYTFVSSNCPAHAPNTQSSQYLRLNNMSANDLLHFFAALYRVPEAQIAAELQPFGDNLVSYLIGQDQSPGRSFAGQIVHLEAFVKPQRNGQPFTKHAWSPYQGPEQSPPLPDKRVAPPPTQPQYAPPPAQAYAPPQYAPPAQAYAPPPAMPPYTAPAPQQAAYGQPPGPPAFTPPTYAAPQPYAPPGPPPGAPPQYVRDPATGQWRLP